MQKADNYFTLDVIFYGILPLYNDIQYNKLHYTALFILILALIQIRVVNCCN